MSNDAETQLATLQANNTADATALAALESDLSSPATESTGDQVLAAVLPVVTTAGLVEVFGADALVSALEADGFTVTPAAPTVTSIPVTDASAPTDTSSDTATTSTDPTSPSA